MTQHHVPRNRLNEIALRRLRTLGIPCGLSPDGRQVRGRLVREALDAGGRPENPLTGRALEQVDFVVEGHDHLRPVSPPAVRGLDPLPFYDAEQAGEVARRIGEAVTRRAGDLQSLAAALRSRGLEPRLDGERLLVVLQLEIAGAGRVVFEGHRPRMTARTLLPDAGPPQPLAGLEVDLAQFDDRTDLEIHVADRLERAAAPAPSTGAARVQAAAAPAPAALTLARLVERFGAACVLEGEVLVRDLLVDGKPVRFAARHRQGTTFAGRLTTSHGVAWEESFDLNRFPGVEPFVLGLLDTRSTDAAAAHPATAAAPASAARPAASAARPTSASAPPAPVGPAPARPAAARSAAPAPALDLGGAMLPVAGETWVMDIQVVEESTDEVRYCAVSASGEPFGAPRVLKREVFERTFVALGGGAWRLLVEVVSVADGAVVYRPLDARRRASGGARKLAAQIFGANFIAEAAAY